ncbi:phosphatidylinositol N-acetylglucosaminyltransferase [Cyathus striatus]|nr:phosphatidylinositol N-acetylglucosaminyltransferase [Cyathus striatus]
MGQWVKALWKRQPYPDNYVPPVFLASLRRNPNFSPYSYTHLLILACPVTQHLATIFIFLAIFVRLKEHNLDPRTLVWITIACFCTGYATWNFLGRTAISLEDRRNTHLKAFKSSILIFLALVSLSPVLRTLTAATSSDSIWALSAVLFALNAILADYSSSTVNGVGPEPLTSVLSMNAAISSSVVLASRLSSDIAVFALVLFAVQAFALFPIFRRRLEASPATIPVLLTCILCGLAIGLTAPLSPTVTWLYVFILFFVTIIAPAVLVWAQRHKNIIRGPWDVAIPKVNQLIQS